MRSSPGSAAGGPQRPVSANPVKHWLTKEASALGFADCRIASAAHGFAGPLRAWLAAGYHAEMAWMADRVDSRASPAGLWPEARSVIALAMNYGPESDPLATLAWPEVGTISVYARNRDYHGLMKGKLKELAQKLQAKTGAKVKVFVDTAPLMEKPLAQAAGLGWQGKHTVLLSRDHGNWLFLGAILTALELEPDSAQADHCGSCRRCLAACPTDAFPAPYVLDSRRCISYLTIEHEGPIDRELRPLMGNRIYGCDDCLAVCPWNKFAQTASEAKLKARPDLEAPPILELLALDDAAFRAKFSGSPIKRTGRDRFIRNVLIAAGNAASPRRAVTREPVLNEADPSLSSASAPLVAAVLAHIDDRDPVVRGAAVWALARLDPAKSRDLRPSRLAVETDRAVREEWEAIA